MPQLGDVARNLRHSLDAPAKHVYQAPVDLGRDVIVRQQLSVHAPHALAACHRICTLFK